MLCAPNRFDHSKKKKKTYGICRTMMILRAVNISESVNIDNWKTKFQIVVHRVTPDILMTN